MSDYNSSLPIRTQANADAVVAIADATVTSQTLAIDASGKVIAKLNDAAGNGITSQVNGSQQALDIGINVAGVQIDPRSIRALTNADVVTAEQGTTPWIGKDQSDGPVTPGTVATYSSLAGGQYNSSAPTLTAAQQSALQLDSSGNLKTNIAVALPAGTNNIGKVSIQDSAGAAFSLTNPLPVIVTDAAAGATDVLDYKAATAVAAAASDTHTYTVTALKTMALKQIVASGSGKIKVEIKINAVTKAVLYNSTANPNVVYQFQSPSSVAAGIAIAVVITNKDNQAQDLHSTIEGYET